MKKTGSVWAVLVAAGSGRRYGGATRKPYLKAGGRPLMWYSLKTFLKHPAVQGVVIVSHPLDMVRAQQLSVKSKKPVIVTAGGAERQDSVKNGLDRLPAGTEWVAIHDAARPLLTPSQLTAVLKGAQATGAAILAVPVPDTTKRENGKGRVLKTVPRKGLWLAQTPQVFNVNLLKKAVRKFGREEVTDDAMWMEHMGQPVRLVPTNGWNIKVTTKADLPVVEALLSQRGRK